MKKTIIVSAFLVAGMAVTSCGNKAGKTTTVPAIDPANMDLSVAPETDFFRYANGGWMAKHALTDEYSVYGAFTYLTDKNFVQLKEIIDEAAAKQQTAGSASQKIATLYNIAMDSVRLNEQGAEPIREYLATIDGVNDGKSLAAMIARMHRDGISPYFFTYVGADEKNSSMNIPALMQAGLGMGDRDYYIEESESAVRDAYRQYILRVFALAGYDEAQAAEAAEAVMKIENKLAAASYDRVALRDTGRNYHKMSDKEWIESNGMIDWQTYFDTLALPWSEEINVMQIDYFNAAAEALKDVTVDEHKWYLRFNLIDAAAPYLSDEFVDTRFDFFGRVLSGSKELRPRWKRAIGTTNSVLSEVLGQLYVEKHFPASSKEKMIELVGNLQTALSERINSLEWMSDETKARAQEKLAAFHVKIGYPDTWRDYSALEIADDSYWANILRSNRFEMDRVYADAGQPVDKDRWLMAPQDINAYYNPTTNEICFPAGILQPPFFNADADDAVNYGAIGVVIGHEMTHGFDDQGRAYDKDGNLNDWWTPEDAAMFKERADKLVAQFDAVEVAPGVYANGAFTLGENIADQGGLLVARKAYENTLKDGVRPEPIDGLTDVQRFYVGYAGVWAQNIRPEEVLLRTKTDPHALAENRVNITLRNIDDFYEAFGIEEGDAMYVAPEDRVNVW